MSTELEITGERAMPGPIDNTALEHLHRYAIARDVCRGKKVLDVASGEGYGTALLAQVAQSVTGVEIFEDAVAHARAHYKRDNLQFMQGDLQKLPNQDGEFDRVTCFETLEHVPDHEKAISEIKRVLKADGICLVSTPCREKYNAMIDHPNQFHVRELEVEEFQELLSKYFKNVEIQLQRIFFGSVLMPLEGASSLSLYKGSFENIEAVPFMEESIYAVAVASDGPLPKLDGTAFQADRFLFHPDIELLRKEVNALRTSTSFRLGQKIINPLFKVKSLLKK